ncbi:uncharacterized protein LOC128277093, partial [Anopheles cruzii]|uniref:uncharacterized protein LOC128277093 n=1 Tax=Anopheles cruzii TaxID=68878 RepID=UPI0022EC9121
AVALLFAGLDAAVKPKTARHDSYGVRDVNEFLSYLNEFNLLNIQERHDDFQNIYNTLKLFSLYENMVLLREYNEQDKELEREHKTYADCFRVNVKQRNTFRRWLDRSRSMVHVFGNDRFDVNFLLLSDVIENEMRPLFDDFCVPKEL